MENNFDDYIQRELDSISNEPIPSFLWDKDKTWDKIALDLKPQKKTISLNWLYAAASILLLLCLLAFFTYQKYTGIICQIKAENDKLIHQVNSMQHAKPQRQPKRVFTIFQTKEKLKTEYIQNTVYVHDTIQTIVYLKNPSQENTNLASTQSAKDSISKSLPMKKNKLHFIMANTASNTEDAPKFKIVGSKKQMKIEPEPPQVDALFKFELN